MLAELLDLPYIALATSLQLSGSSTVVKREVQGGEETVEVSLPVVVSCQKGMAEARIPNMRGIMAARTKPLKVVEPISIEPLTTVAEFSLPPAKAGVKLVTPDNVDELIRLLHEEARVI
jgi:electron transfer flavoprotein beta subunit